MQFTTKEVAEFCRTNMVAGNRSLDYIDKLADLVLEPAVKESLTAQLVMLRENTPPGELTEDEFQHGASFVMGFSIGMMFGAERGGPDRGL